MAQLRCLIIHWAMKLCPQQRLLLRQQQALDLRLQQGPPVTCSGASMSQALAERWNLLEAVCGHVQV